MTNEPYGRQRHNEGSNKVFIYPTSRMKKLEKTGPKTFRRLLRRCLFSTKIYRKAIVHISPERMGVTIIYCCHKGFSSYCMSKPLLYHERRKKRCSVYSLFSSFTEFSKDRKWYEATFSSPLEQKDIKTFPLFCAFHVKE